MGLMLLSQFELCSNPIGTGDQQGLPHSGWQPHHSPEAAQSAHHFRAVGGLDGCLDPLNESPSGFDVHAGTLVIHHSLRLSRSSPAAGTGTGGRCLQNETL